MKTIRLTTSSFLAALLALVLVVQPIFVCAGDTPLPEPNPDTLLRQMSAELSNAGIYRFHAEITAAHHIAIVEEER